VKAEREHYCHAARGERRDSFRKFIAGQPKRDIYGRTQPVPALSPTWYDSNGGRTEHSFHRDILCRRIHRTGPIRQRQPGRIRTWSDWKEPTSSVRTSWKDLGDVGSRRDSGHDLAPQTIKNTLIWHLRGVPPVRSKLHDKILPTMGRCEEALYNVHGLEPIRSSWSSQVHLLPFVSIYIRCRCRMHTITVGSIFIPQGRMTHEDLCMPPGSQVG